MTEIYYSEAEAQVLKDKVVVLTGEHGASRKLSPSLTSFVLLTREQQSQQEAHKASAQQQ